MRKSMDQRQVEGGRMESGSMVPNRSNWLARWHVEWLIERMSVSSSFGRSYPCLGAESSQSSALGRDKSVYDRIEMSRARRRG
jgi:hypothetical protein